MATHLRSDAFAAVDALTNEHGWPWELKDGGVDDGLASIERARNMLALAWTEGYGAGLETMRGVVDTALDSVGKS